MTVAVHDKDILPSVSVVVCAFTERRWDVLSSCLKALTEQTWVAEQCILVIDHNSELLSRALEAFPGVEIVENREKQGAAGSRNTGIALSRSEIVAFVDDDAVADPSWLEELVRPYSDHSIMGTAGVARADWVGGRPDWYPSEFEWVVGCSYRGLPTAIAPIRNAIAASMSYRRNVFTEVGTFDCDMGRVWALPLGCEETLHGIRVQQFYGQGAIVHVPTSIVDHQVPAERATVRYLMRRCFAEGISKAAVAQRVGASDGSSAERRYVLKVLPSGIISGILRCTRGETAGLAVSGLILTGLTLTILGYAVGLLGLAGPVSRGLIWISARTNQPTR
jgi:hypothetical protein